MTQARRVYQAEIDTTVRGIPCIIGVLDYERVYGSFSYNAPSDLDHDGYIDCEWDLLDRKGYPAKWLERKLTSKDRDQIDDTIIDYMEG